MRNVLLAIVLICPMMTYAVCNSPVSRTNYVTNTKLDSTKLNLDFNNAYARLNDLPGDCVTDGSITSAKIKDNEIVNADIKTGAGITMNKTNFAVAILKDVKAAGTAGGGCTTGAWRTRDLNTEKDPDNFVVLASNQFTLPIGTYLVEGSVPGYGGLSFSSRLRNITSSTDAIIGESITGTDNVRNGYSKFTDILELTTSTVFEVQHSCDATVAGNGFGAGSAGTSAASEVFTTVKITRIK